MSAAPTSAHLEEMFLSKRGCVSDCVVPSCSSISCSAAETCILSSQTCSSCPSVSCVSLSLTVTDNATEHDTIPKGAIAGIVVACLLLLCSITFLAWHIQKRRNVIREITEKAGFRDDYQDLEENSDDGNEDGCSRVSRSNSQVASIQIALGEELKLTSGNISPLPTPDHFFSADDLLRMSYAESASSRTNSMNNVTRATNGDTDAAIMQANNPIVAVRAKASVMKIQRPPYTIDNAARRSRPRELTLEHSNGASGPVLGSFWENDSDSILESPIETDFISPRKFKESPAKKVDGETFSQHSLTPTKPKLGRSLTSDTTGSLDGVGNQSVLEQSMTLSDDIRVTLEIASPLKSATTVEGSSTSATEDDKVK